MNLSHKRGSYRRERRETRRSGATEQRMSPSTIRRGRWEVAYMQSTRLTKQIEQAPPPFLPTPAPSALLVSFSWLRDQAIVVT